MSKNYFNKLSLGGVIITLGIIYGDIGTSPMYVMDAIIGKRAISETLVLGAASLVFWTLTILTTVKYVVLTLTADNNGEGGVFSLFALVRKYSKRLVIITIIGAVTLLDDGILTPPISISSAVEGLHQIKGIGQYFQQPLLQHWSNYKHGKAAMFHHTSSLFLYFFPQALRKS